MTKKTKNLLTIIGAILIIPAVGWFIGYILRSAFGGVSGGWAFTWGGAAGLISMPFVTPFIAIPFGIGLFFGIKEKPYGYFQ